MERSITLTIVYKANTIQFQWKSLLFICSKKNKRKRNLWRCRGRYLQFQIKISDLIARLCCWGRRCGNKHCGDCDVSDKECKCRQCVAKTTQDDSINEKIYDRKELATIIIWICTSSNQCTTCVADIKNSEIASIWWVYRIQCLCGCHTVCWCCSMVCGIYFWCRFSKTSKRET